MRTFRPSALLVAAALMTGLFASPAQADEVPAPEPTVTATPTPTDTPAPVQPSETTQPPSRPSSSEKAAPVVRPNKPKPKMLVVGDSMSAWYSDEDTVSRAWWSMVAAHFGYTPVLSAESGSGMWARGNKCQGTRFGERLDAIDKVKPTFIYVAGGFNDRYGCNAKNKKVRIKKASTIKSFNTYYRALGERADRNGIDRKNIYVFTPWGSSYRSDHYWVWRAQKAAAEANGLTYLTIRFNDRKHTLDGIHPNYKGNENWANQIIWSIT